MVQREHLPVRSLDCGLRDHGLGCARASPVSCTVSDARMDTAVTTNDEHENSRRRATVRRLRLSPTFSSLTGKWIHPLAGVLALATTNVAAKGAASSVDSPVGRPQGGLGPPPRRHLLALTRGALLRDMGRYGEMGRYREYRVKASGFGTVGGGRWVRVLWGYGRRAPAASLAPAPPPSRRRPPSPPRRAPPRPPRRPRGRWRAPPPPSTARVRHSCLHGCVASASQEGDGCNSAQ